VIAQSNSHKADQLLRDFISRIGEPVRSFSTRIKEDNPNYATLLTAYQIALGRSGSTPTLFGSTFAEWTKFRLEYEHYIQMQSGVKAIRDCIRQDIQASIMMDIIKSYPAETLIYRETLYR